MSRSAGRCRACAGRAHSVQRGDARVPGVSRAAAIASVTSIGYSGFMIAPPLIGGIATVTSLTAALGVVVLASGLLAYGARFVPQKPASYRRPE